MKNVLKDSKCSNCRACYFKCPKSAITMDLNIEGFYSAVIDENKCIGCNLCINVCPVENKREICDFYDAECYALINKNKDDLQKSSSGGIFKLLCEFVLSKDGVVCAPAFNDKFNLSHVFVFDVDFLDTIICSKYVESNLNDCFKDILKYLKKGTLVLFSGTPCQVAGLKCFLGKDYINLLTQDIVCHGVPSPKLWLKYISEFDNVSSVQFRNKDYGWENFAMTVNCGKSKYSKPHYDDNYMKLFLNDVCLKESCYECVFKNGNSYADITLGDFWGISKIFPAINFKNGVTMLMINSIKGMTLYDNVLNNAIVLGKCKVSDVSQHNPALCKSAKYRETRSDFFRDLNNCKIRKLARKYGKHLSKKDRLKKLIKKVIRG